MLLLFFSWLPGFEHDARRTRLPSRPAALPPRRAAAAGPHRGGRARPRHGGHGGAERHEVLWHFRTKLTPAYFEGTFWPLRKERGSKGALPPC